MPISDTVPVSMAALTCLPNPLYPGEVLIFFLTDKNTLSLQRRKGQFLDHQNPISSVATGNLLNPSSFASTICKNIINIYGFTNDNRICQLSPYFAPITSGNGTVTKVSSLAATSDGISSGWLYFLKDDPVRIYERPISYSASSNVMANAYQPQSDSYLAAFYDSVTRERCVIYQASTNGAIHCYNTQTQTDKSIEGTSSIAKPHTPLAVVCIQDPLQERRSKAYLYYCNTNGVLYRVIGNASGVWGSSEQVRGTPPTLGAWTQLSVVPDIGAEINEVFYVGVDADDFTGYQDKW